MGIRLLSESPTLSVADRRCLLLFELSYRGTKFPLIDRPCDEDKRARADRAAGTLVLVGLLEIGMELYTEKQQFLSSTPDSVTWDCATSHSCFLRPASLQDVQNPENTLS